MVTTRTNLTHQKSTGRYGNDIDIIGVHTMEAPEGAQTAENVANYFKTVKASSHWCVDNNSRVRVVNDEDTAWTLPGANTRSLNIELAGYAKQSPNDWADAYSVSMLEIAALCCAEWCKKYGIPVRRLSLAQIRNGEKGFAGHVDVNFVYRKSTHWDPGPGFPWTYFLSRVNDYLNALNNGTAPSIPSTPDWDNKGFSLAYIQKIQRLLNKLGYNLLVDGVLGPITTNAVLNFQKAHSLVQDGSPGPITLAALNKATLPPVNRDIRVLQRAVNTVDDNDWGPVTTRHFEAVRAASLFGGNKFPYGVQFAQKVVKALQDGNWGPKSWLAHDATVYSIQRALKDLGYYGGYIDGVWATMTDTAYLKAKAALSRG